MSFITGILSTIIAGYLAAVTGLADMISLQLQYLAPQTEAEETETIEATETAETYTEPEAEANQEQTSAIDSIPHILLENAAYQKAAVVESIQPEKATGSAYEALVNIFCEHKSPDYTQFTTGTGFFIDTEGVILTNAHVAHFLLMDDIIGETTCVIRTGNPATAKYHAELLYISPSWIRENAAMFRNQAPKGTGERDYALLYVTDSVDGTELPNSFPALPFDTELMRTSAVDQIVYAAGYPASAVIASLGKSDLVPRLATTSIAELMTFGSNYADIFSIYGTAVGERGVSGGPVVTTDGDVIGLISTKGDSKEFGEGSLRAITMSYIDRTITEETGFSLLENISGNIPYRAEIFNSVMVPYLKLTLEQEL